MGFFTCTTKKCSIFFLLSFFGSVAFAVAGYLVVTATVNSQVCENVCIPTPNDVDWLRDAWQNNRNASRNPPEYMKFKLFNITNPDQILNGSKPIVVEIGPFVYRMYREKVDIVYSDDMEQVSYRELKTYHFEEKMSNVSDSVTFTGVTLPVVGSLQLLAHLNDVDQWKASAPTLSGLCGAGASPDPCLFSTFTAREFIWGYNAQDLQIGNLLFFQNNPYFEPNFQLFFNDTNSTQQEQVWYNSHNYGLGGRCDEIASSTVPSITVCKPPNLWPNSSGSLKTTLRTGHSSSLSHSLQHINSFVSFRGNTSLDVWENPSPVRGHDQYQFQTRLAKTDKVAVFDEKLMRPVDLVYSKDTSEFGIDMYRFVPDPYFFSGQVGARACRYASCDNHGTCDELTGECACPPGFFGNRCQNNSTKTACDHVSCNGHGTCAPSSGQCVCDTNWSGQFCTLSRFKGTADISEVSAMTYGASVPMKMTEWYQRGVDRELREAWVQCQNCPDPDKLTAEETGIYVDIEPNTGKTLRGARRGQLNIMLGTQDVFGKCDKNDLDDYPWSCMQESLLPVLAFEQIAEMTEENSDVVNDGLTLLNLAKVGISVCTYVLPIVAFLSLMLSIYLCKKHRAKMASFDYERM